MLEDENRTERGAGRDDEAVDDPGAVVDRLRAELDAARERVCEAWERYRRETRNPPLPAIALAVLQVLTQGI